MKKVKTKSGIELQVDERIVEDARLVRMLAKMSRYEKDPVTAVQALDNLLDFIFGSEDKTLVFMNAVAEKHDGICKAEHMINELTEVLEAVKGKN